MFGLTENTGIWLTKISEFPEIFSSIPAQAVEKQPIRQIKSPNQGLCVVFWLFCLAYCVK